MRSEHFILISIFENLEIRSPKQLISLIRHAERDKDMLKSNASIASFYFKAWTELIPWYLFNFNSSIRVTEHFDVETVAKRGQNFAIADVFGNCNCEEFPRSENCAS